MSKIRVGIVGYGNLGRGVELAIGQNDDMELACIFTRRDPAQVKPVGEVMVASTSQMEEWKGKLDVVILCGGSATDLPNQTPQVAKMFSVIDSFDTHANIPEHFARVDKACKEAGTLGLISAGWDPGLFSLNRIYAESILRQGSTYTFWGRGVSQGHSDAIRRIPGVKNAIQYTIPVEKALEAVRSGEAPVLTTRQKHTRECFVVMEENADQEAIRQAIITMPNYFSDYDTIVTFMDEDDFAAQHGGMPHGGFVMRSGITGEGTRQMIEFSLRLESNPEFTASVLVAYARAVFRMAAKGEIGAKTVFDIAPALLSPLSAQELCATML